MAKKPTKKIKQKIEGTEVMTVKVAQPQIQSEAQNVIAAMNSLQATEGWALLTKILTDNIKYLETAILGKIDPATKLVLDEKEIEACRLKRSLNIDLLATPKNYAKVVRDAGEIPVDYDPYFKTNEDIIKSKATPPADDRGGK